MRKEDSSDEVDNKNKQTFTVHIGNLPFSVDKDQLRGAFKEFGKVLHASVSLDERGNSRGFGVIEYEGREAAEQAVLSMDKASFNGREVSVKAPDLQWKRSLVCWVRVSSLPFADLLFLIYELISN